MAIRPASIKVRALRWLAQREHSRSELRDKLLRLLARPPRGAPEALCGAASPVDGATDAEAAADPAAEVEVLLGWLEAHGYLSDIRFAASRVRLRQPRFGTLRIQQELKQHGLSLDPEARQALRQSEAQRAYEVWRKKYGTVALNAAGRLRQMRFLAGRGFSADVVRRVVLIGAPADDDLGTGPDTA